jgi:hypothetical protein
MTTKNFASVLVFRSKIINLKKVMTKEIISKEIMTKEIIYSQHFPTEAPKFLHALYHMF